MKASIRVAILSAMIVGGVQLLAIPAFGSVPAIGEVHLASVTASPEQAEGNGSSSQAEVSADGKWMVFQSTASNLGGPDSGGRSQIYLRDLVRSETRIISTTADGSASGDGQSTRPSLSADGTTVAYISTSRNLVGGVSTGTAQVFLWRQGLGTSLASPRENPPLAPSNGSALDVDLSENGLALAFSSTATDLASGFWPLDGSIQVFQRDLRTGVSLHVSGPSRLGMINFAGSDPSISGDGSIVAFVGDGYRQPDDPPQIVVVGVRGGGRVITHDISGSGVGNSDSSQPSVSVDGSTVVYSSTATNLVDTPGDGHRQVYAWNANTNRSTLISGPTGSGRASSHHSGDPKVSSDGTTVVFTSEAADVLPRSVARSQAVVRSLMTGKTTLVSRAPDGSQADSPVDSPSISGDGKIVAFDTQSPNLTSPPSSGRSQVYIANSVEKEVIERRGGADRYEMSAFVSGVTFPEAPPVVYVASGQVFPDALAASATAGWLRGPVLLVSKDAVSAGVAQELTRLRPERIVVVGGINSVSMAVEEALASYAPSVSRVAGEDRYEVAALVSARTPRPAGGRAPRYPIVYIASGEVFADALSASAVAGDQMSPVLLVSRDHLPPSTRLELARLEPSEIVVVGGSATVSEAVVTALSKIARTSRVAGSDRFAVSAKITADHFQAAIGGTVFVASGMVFPDALSGGAAAIQSGSPVLLIRPDGIPSSVAAELDRLNPSKIVVLGGPATISDETAAKLGVFLG